MHARAFSLSSARCSTTFTVIIPRRSGNTRCNRWRSAWEPPACLPSGWAAQLLAPCAAGECRQADVTIAYAELPGKTDMARPSRPVPAGLRIRRERVVSSPRAAGRSRKQFHPAPVISTAGPDDGRVYTFDRGEYRAMVDFDLHQKRLKSYLENESAAERAVASDALWPRRRANSPSWAQSWPSIPEGSSTGYRRQKSAQLLHDRLIRRSPARCGGGEALSGELAAACFASTICTSGCRSWSRITCRARVRRVPVPLRIHRQADHPVSAQQQHVRFPAGVLSLNGWGNYAEIERQAEKLYSMPPERMVVIQRSPDRRIALGLPRARGVRRAARRRGQTRGPGTRPPARRTSTVISSACSTAPQAMVESTYVERFDQVQPKATVGSSRASDVSRASFAGGMVRSIYPATDRRGEPIPRTDPTSSSWRR
jgi:hypothetical protein